MSKADANGLVPCRTCGRKRPLRFFNVAGRLVLKSGAVSQQYQADCRECQEKARRAAGMPKRHQRRNARGDYWCNNCRRYRDGDAFRDHPSPGREGTKWAYCRDCERELDRIKYRMAVATPDGRAQVREARNAAKRRRSLHLARDRRETIALAIRVVLDRGLTKAEICRLVDCTIQCLIGWERGEVRFPAARFVNRLLALMQATKHLPAGHPAPGRRTPHPDLPELERVMALVRAEHRPGKRTGATRPTPEPEQRMAA
jgi:hypothetical protein